MRDHLRRLAILLHPHASSIEGRFERRLKQLQLKVKERTALAAITPGAVARALARGQSAGAFFEQVEYQGRRLAKLNLPPSQVLSALEDYDKLLAPVLGKLIPSEYANFQWVREQLHFCVILTLNNAYYQVREAETQAFYDLFRVELESRNLGELSERFLATLAQFCRADAANLYLLEPQKGVWQNKASVNGAGGARKPPVEWVGDPKTLRWLRSPRCWDWDRARATPGVLLDASWRRKFESCWSIPLLAGTRLAGVMQFGFKKPYEWLPREQELLSAAAERCLMAAEKARLVENLARREQQVLTLAEHMLHVEEAERRRISRELHDEAGQSLLVVRLQLEMIEQSIEDAGVRTRLGDVREQTERTILEIRRLIAALSPAVLEQLGLGAALRQLVSRFRRVHNAKVKLQLARLQNLPKKLEIIVYRLVQECCNNIAKHSLAAHVNISATTADGVLRLKVEDDGIGFHVEEALEKRGSFGLSGIRERVALLGGKLEIDSTPSQTGSRQNPGKTEEGPGERTRVEGRVSKGTRIRMELPILKGAPRL